VWGWVGSVAVGATGIARSKLQSVLRRVQQHCAACWARVGWQQAGQPALARTKNAMAWAGRHPQDTNILAACLTRIY
jgi:hypothetical protein